jgi:hypothetical protein
LTAKAAEKRSAKTLISSRAVVRRNDLFVCFLAAALATAPAIAGVIARAYATAIADVAAIAPVVAHASVFVHVNANHGDLISWPTN